jgi:NTE family protein
VRVARALGADIVIAFDVSMQPTERPKLGSNASMVTQAFVVMAGTIAKEETKLADVVLQPELAGMSVTDMSARARAIAAGEDAARAALPQIRRLIELKSAAKAEAALGAGTARQ